MNSSYWDAITEITITYLHEWIDSKDKPHFDRSYEEWLTRRGFYGDTCIILHPPFERWRKMMGMPPTRKVNSYYEP